ncbi:hypothetical protein [Crystallibacter degradans]|uniref:hypothetical protein n=1 Tax=Crystallibacter degradans TaxID=2726743 RepID=UPI0014750D35|nr:hypothetical protein [Arthrobacter sp. SF27]NMR28661.1 hypothetical protein [Arthrobacter sp. SF27]
MDLKHRKMALIKRARGAASSASDQMVAVLIRKLRDSVAANGRTLEGVDLDRVVASITRTLPDKDNRNHMVDRVGPFYDTAGLERWLGISRQALRKRVQSHKLLACKTEDNVLLYPVWQFRDDGTLIPGLHEVLEILADGMEAPWSWGLWLTARVDDELGGMSAADWLASGRDPERVKDLAREDAAGWAA